MKIVAKLVLTLWALSSSAWAQKADPELAAATKALEAKNYKAAAVKLKPLAEKGNPRAQFNYGLLYENGLGTEKNMAEAVKWYRKSAEAGHLGAAKMLGQIYGTGKDVPADSREAVRWFEAAAKKGDAESEFNVALLSFDIVPNPGNTAPQDPAKAIKWYRRAADHGHVGAATNLGTIYMSKTPRSKENIVEAEKYFKRAAIAGDVRSQFNMGLINWSEQGLGINPVTAFAWLSLAKANGHAQAPEVLKALQPTLTQQQLKDAGTYQAQLSKQIAAAKGKLPKAEAKPAQAKPAGGKPAKAKPAAKKKK